MGNQTYFTRFRTLDGDDVQDRAPRVTDPDGLEAALDQRQGGPSMDDLVTQERTDHDTYPKETWIRAYGFKQYHPLGSIDKRDHDSAGSVVEAIRSYIDNIATIEVDRLHTAFGLSNFGVEYAGADATASLFATISEHTEPFEVWNYTYSTSAIMAARDGPRTVYRIRARDGDVAVKKYELGLEPVNEE